MAPIGIPYGRAKSSREEEYPGSIRSEGIALAYRGFITDRFYTALQALPLQQTFLDTNGEEIAQGKQLFMKLRFGLPYGGTLFMEPSLAFTYWPINEGLPQSFQAKEDPWPNHFLFEPGLHVRMNF